MFDMTWMSDREAIDLYAHRLEEEKVVVEVGQKGFRPNYMDKHLLVAELRDH